MLYHLLCSVRSPYHHESLQRHSYGHLSMLYHLLRSVRSPHHGSLQRHSYGHLSMLYHLLRSVRSPITGHFSATPMYHLLRSVRSPHHGSLQRHSYGNLSLLYHLLRSVRSPITGHFRATPMGTLACCIIFLVRLGPPITGHFCATPMGTLACCIIFFVRFTSAILVNPLRMLRILTNAFANFANACERLTNEMTTQRMRGEPACQCFAASHLLARLYLEWPICFIRNGFASIRNVLFAFRMDECYQILTNVLRSLQMPCHQ